MTKGFVATIAGVALVFVLVTVVMSQPAASPPKWALLVGIDEYAAVTPLAGCVNDVEAMKAVLVGRFDFPPENIAVLKNAEASRDGILQGLRSLIGRTSAGDIVVFHYSGHGSRMRDAPNGDGPTAGTRRSFPRIAGHPASSTGKPDRFALAVGPDAFLRGP